MDQVLSDLNEDLLQTTKKREYDYFGNPITRKKNSSRIKAKEKLQKVKLSTTVDPVAEKKKAKKANTSKKATKVAGNDVDFSGLSLQYLKDNRKPSRTGMPTKLTEDLLQVIRSLYVEDGRPLHEIYKVLNLNRATVFQWTTKNFLGWRDFLREIKDERIVAMARDNMPELLSSPKESIRSSNTQFVLETKGGYSKKQELNVSNRGFISQEETEEMLRSLRDKCDTE